MSANSFKIKKSVVVDPQGSSVVSEKGEIAYNSSTDKYEGYTSTADALVQENKTQTITNKTLNSTNSITVLDTNLTLADNSDGTKQAKFELSGITTSTTRTLTVPDADTTLVGTGATQSLSNKTLDSTNSITVKDASFTVVDDGDTTKQLKFQASGITTSTTRTLTAPDANTTIVGTDATQTLTNKTLSGNTAATLISGSGTLTLNTTGTITVPGATDTLVGKATTDTLSNKTLSDSLTFTQIATPSNPASSKNKLYFKSDNTLYSLTSGGTETAITGTSGVFADNAFTIQDNGDATKQLKFEVSTITTGTTRTLTVPNASTTLIGTDTTDALSNKTTITATSDCTLRNVIAGQTASNTISAADSFQCRQQDGAMFFNGSVTGLSAGENTNNCMMRIRKDTTTGRSLNVAGTISAGSALITGNNDFAEYMERANHSDTILAGEICGINSTDKVTKKFSESIAFLVKSTTPGVVGGEPWFQLEDIEGESEEDKQARSVELENNSEEMAYVGRVPLLIDSTLVTPGDWIVPVVGTADSIAIQVVSDADITFAQYKRAVGQVWSIIDGTKVVLAVGIK